MNNTPEHVAIIMDGNGRWAKKRGLPRFAGHKRGIDNVKNIIEAAKELGIKVLTIFAFSTENWSRPKDEVNMLMNSLYDFLVNNLSELNKENIRLIVCGKKDKPIPDRLLMKLTEVEKETENNKAIILNLAFNYGSRQELLEAVKNIASDVKNNKIEADSIDEKKFSQYLYTKGLPDPDLLIRTSGEKRISNFLLWQISYCELYFTDTFWPDFDKNELKKALNEFALRNRRFGKI